MIELNKNEHSRAFALKLPKKKRNGKEIRVVKSGAVIIFFCLLLRTEIKNPVTVNKMTGLKYEIIK